MLPRSWLVLDDGRIVTKTYVFYNDGTYFNYNAENGDFKWNAKNGIDFDNPMKLTLDEFIKETKFSENVLEVPKEWI